MTSSVVLHAVSPDTENRYPVSRYRNSDNGNVTSFVRFAANLECHPKCQSKCHQPDTDFREAVR